MDEIELKSDYKNYILSDAWYKKRKLAFKLFGKACQRCKKTKKLHVHHKTYEHFKEEIIETELAVLCQKCHTLYHKKFKQTGVLTTDLFIKKHFETGNVEKQKVRKPSALKKQRKYIALHDPSRHVKVDLLGID